MYHTLLAPVITVNFLPEALIVPFRVYEPETENDALIPEVGETAEAALRIISVAFFPEAMQAKGKKTIKINAINNFRCFIALYNNYLVKIDCSSSSPTRTVLGFPPVGGPTIPAASS